VDENGVEMPAPEGAQDFIDFFISFALQGWESRAAVLPRAGARGYILTPLRGWAAAISKSFHASSTEVVKDLPAIAFEVTLSRAENPVAG